MVRRDTNLRTALLSVAVGLVGLTVAVVITTSAQGVDPESEKELAAKVASIDAELSSLRDAGLDKSSEVYQSLLDDRAHVLESALA